MHWLTPPWVVYDIPNETIYFMDNDTILTDEDLRNNKIKMPYPQAERIRKAKNLPMPRPAVKVVLSDEEHTKLDSENDKDYLGSGLMGMPNRERIQGIPLNDPEYEYMRSK